ncbi:DUF1080 domain-containing protein [Gemmata sp. JC673]|uniref:DUF1080 domain-containing protein n=1 Tax=Gemmata algarum TaxID=2975278 RepID=A0ABU5ES75_9BACT|nr:DUF1080 domain-containing protein [Gemmata algarum]MDY3557813.1 DUF1080 domain-containing protein [Gemmata algarum]
MHRLVALVAAVFAGAVAGADEPKKLAAGADGWIDLMRPEVWKKVDDRWIFAGEVKLAPDAKGKADVRLKAEKKPGGAVWVNGETGRLPNLITKEAFGDCEIHVEFLIAKGSNAGVKFHEVYEIQIQDDYGKKNLDGRHMGGIYPRANLEMGGYLDKGVPPKVNAAKPFGEWQTLEATWKSPRFNEKGEKVASAVVVNATLNGQVIHENAEVKTPTGSNWGKKETPTGAFMLQTDHGPTAFRNVRIRPLK